MDFKAHGSANINNLKLFNNISRTDIDDKYAYDVHKKEHDDYYAQLDNIDYSSYNNDVNFNDSVNSNPSVVSLVSNTNISDAGAISSSNTYVLASATANFYTSNDVLAATLASSIQSMCLNFASNLQNFAATIV